MKKRSHILDRTGMLLQQSWTEDIGSLWPAILHPCEMKPAPEGKSVPHVRLALEFNAKSTSSSGKHGASMDSKRRHQVRPVNTLANSSSHPPHEIVFWVNFTDKDINAQEGQLALNHTADGESHLLDPNSMLFHGTEAFLRTERWLQRMGEIET